MLEGFLPSLTTNWPYILLASILVVSLSGNYFNNGLNKYPAPFPAPFTNSWRFLSVLRGKPQIELRKLHDQLGDVVRVGPNALSFSNPEAIKAIYGLNNRLNKVCLQPNLLEEVFDKQIEWVLSSTDAGVKRRGTSISIRDTGPRLSYETQTDRQQCILHDFTYSI